MADRENPNTHIENEEITEPRVQPESPRNEGIDPLTEGDTMYPAEDTKSDSEKLGKRDEKAADEAAKKGDVPEDLQRQADTVEAQSHLQSSTDGEPSPNETPNPMLTDREEPLRSGNERTEPVKADGKVQPQTKKPAKTNDSKVADGSTEPSADDTNAATGEGKSDNRKAAESNAK